MRTAKVPRPLSIKLFAAMCSLAAFVGLLRGLLNPFVTQGDLWFYTGRMLGEDEAIVTHFALFTIALIPIFWIYFVASPIARWIVVGFAILRLWPLAINPLYLGYAVQHNPIELVAPLLQMFAIALLFSPSANRYFHRENDETAT